MRGLSSNVELSLGSGLGASFPFPDFVVILNVEWNLLNLEWVEWNLLDLEWNE